MSSPSQYRKGYGRRHGHKGDIEPRLSLQETLTRWPRLAAIVDVMEAASGLALAVFLWMHMALVGSILLGKASFNAIPRFLDGTHLSVAGIPLLVAVFFVHALLAGRKLPGGYREQRILWSHARRLRHRDTWAWFAQAVSGMGLLIFAGIHLWIILTTWPIEASVSASRVAQLHYLAFYLVLLVLGEVHAGIGLYRLAIKWGWPPRRPARAVLEVFGIALVGLGLVALYVFRNLGLS